MNEQDRLNHLDRVDHFQAYLEHLTHEHEKLRVRCHGNSTASFLRIVDALDTTLRESIGSTGELARLFLGVVEHKP